ncbi:hypothetical protein [Mesorhizobium sp. B2-5-3]|uniref:hypothetical protein n=1 Tax=Mesorhizobium sp. B2-5-3 TaxID=2589927 RepID=UPI00112C98CC|nr:hypothetical protein [Mesorhizobium sp. B2-5-3]TPK31704.1 hypothetical protein FJ867_22510 [Mesorhizobium sp. B2-5-3]
MPEEYDAPNWKLLSIMSFGRLNRYSIFDNYGCYALIALVVAIFFLYSFDFTGPSYLADEIGYLANAAALAGYVSDSASSYQFGYSLLISPLFRMTNNTDVIWHGIVAVNALLFSTAFFLLYKLSFDFEPSLSPGYRLSIIALCSAYPAWISISGYAFSQSAFVFVFMLALTFLIHAVKGQTHRLPWHGLCVGYLFAIHVTGAVVALSSFVVIFWLGLSTRKWRPVILSASATLVVILGYKVFFHPWMVDLMTPDQQSPAIHYPSMTAVLLTLAHRATLIETVIRSLGTFAYLSIATIGFLTQGIGAAISRLWTARTHLKPVDPIQISMLFCLLSLAGIVLVGSMMFTDTRSYRPDHWMYGRYAEGVLLPLLFIGFATERRLVWVVSALLLPLIFLATLSTNSQTPWMYTVAKNWGLSEINTSGFWPFAMSGYAPFWCAIIIASLISAVVPLLPRSLATIAVAAFFVMCMAIQWFHHEKAFKTFARPSGLTEFVRSNWRTGSCLALDTSLPDGATAVQYQRLALYKYYLFDYDIQRMTYDEWNQRCSGPRLSFRISISDQYKIPVVAKEAAYGLMVWSHKPLPAYGNTYAGLFTGDDPCVTSSCFDEDAYNMAQFTNVGKLSDDHLMTTTTEGVLIFGPYLPVRSGTYRFTASGDFADTEGLYADVAVEEGKTLMFGKRFSGIIVNDILSFDFIAPRAFDDFQVRLFVSDKTKIALKSYAIRPIPEAELTNIR